MPSDTTSDTTRGAAARGLSVEQRTFFLDNGYLLVDPLLRASELQPLIDELAERVDRTAREAHAAGRLRKLFDDEPFARRLAKICASMEDCSDVWRFAGEKYRSVAMAAVMTHPAILDAVESVIGPEILAHPQFNVRAKLPDQELTVVPWHQDLAYLRPEADPTLIMNFWIPLVDATAENGCVEVMPGSHRAGLLPHERIRNYQGIPDDKVPPGPIVTCPVRVGGALLLQPKTIHRSIPNRSDHVRWSLDLRYSDPALPTGRPQAKGFIARSAARPGAVAASLDEWLRYRTSGTDAGAARPWTWVRRLGRRLTRRR
jgi:phytanoyl-CoA hydroxylase